VHEGGEVGAYRTIRQIGAGGMGEVWLAEHTLLGRRAAIKFLHPTFSSRTDVVTRFFNEARAATSIADPGIVQIFDFGHHTDGSAYIVMELLEGETLDARLRREGPLAVTEALRIMRQVSSSLGAAHVRGIVHRDLKPENIFLVRDPEVPGGERAKILDFGIAKLSDDTSIKTQTSAVMGTPTFMSPEQCRGAGHVDQRADVYSLGCVLFTILVGTPVFIADGAGELIAMHLREPAPRAASRRADIPPAVDALIARCLEKDPAVRLADGSTLAAAVAEIAASLALVGDPLRSAPSATPLSLPSGARAPIHTTLSGSAAALPTTPRSTRRLWMASAATLLIGAAIALAVHSGRASRDAGVASPSDAKTPTISPAPASHPPDAAVLAALPAPDRNEAAVAQLRAAVDAFVAWSPTHPGAGCPSALDLGLSGAALDPWGNPIAITCTDQPAEQQTGLISAGSDGVLHTNDDLTSWTLGRDVIAKLRGPRWEVAPVLRHVTYQRPPARPAPHPTPPGRGSALPPAPLPTPAPAAAPPVVQTGSASISSGVTQPPKHDIPRTR
jgi:serine/threonine-protein kinase